MGNDAERLQGTWAVQTLTVDGQEMPAGMLGEARITIAGDRFASTGMGTEYGGTVTLNAAQDPPQIDLKFDTGPEAGNLNRGIYRLDGDSWTICLATRGDVRPDAFQAPPGSGFALETFTRGSGPAATKSKARKPKAAESAASTGPVTEFEGEWPMVSGVMDGVPLDDSMVKWVKRVTQGNQTTVIAGPKVMLKVEFTHDASQSPKTIDYVNLAGAHKGKAQHGIYELEGDVLRVCVAAPEAPRPQDFDSVKGDGRTFTVWKRG